MNAASVSQSTEKLKTLAQSMGVQLSYKSAFGTVVESSPQGMLAVLSALGGLPLKKDLSNLDDMAKQQAAEKWGQLSEPVIVIWEGKAANIPFRLPTKELASAKKAKLAIRFENKRKLALTVDLSKLAVAEQASIGGVEYTEKTIELKRRFPAGYHEGVLTVGTRKHTFMIISAPWTAYKPAKANARALGVFAPLYAVHSEASMGIGDFTDLEKLVNWAYSQKCDFVGTLPMLSIFNDKPVVEPSPYSPLSRLFWNEMYVDPRATREWKGCKQAQARLQDPAFRQELERLKSADQVDYQAVARLKRSVLELLSEVFFSKKGDKTPEFKKFLTVYPGALDYAEFRACCEKKNVPWREWPERLQEGDVRTGDYDEKDKRYHLYAQFQAHQQLLRVAKKSKSKGRGVYIDFPLSAHADGYDVWRERDSFAQGVSAGCPPDPAHVHGQNWGILPLNPRTIRRNGYRYVRACLESHMRYAGLLRLDHVMAFYRLYWVPHGMGAKDGVYVRYNLDEFFALLVLESHRNKCTLIGEDLGTVPQEIRDAMTEHSILRMYVQQRRLGTDAKEPLPPVPVDCICSLNTHDMPPFAAFWEGLDIHDKLDLGYFGKNELDAKLKAREDQKNALLGFLVASGYLKNTNADVQAVFHAMLRLTASDPVQVMQINIEDLWQETLSQNVPGTWKERPNWRRKCRYGVEELGDIPGITALFKELARQRKSAKRAPVSKR